MNLLSAVVAGVRAAVGFLTLPSRGAFVHQTRVPFPSWSPASPTVLRRLREYDANLDYYVLPNGGILLLEYDPTAERVTRGRELLAKGHRHVFDYELMAAGFSLCSEMDFPPWAIETGQLYHAADRWRGITPDMIEASHAVRVAESDGTAHERRVEERTRDRMQGEGRSDHRILFRHRKSFSYNSSHLGQRPVRT